MKSSPIFSIARRNAVLVVSGFLIAVVLFVLFVIFANLASGQPALTVPFLESSTPALIPSAVPTATFTPIPATFTPAPGITSTALPPEGEAFSIGKSVEGKSLDVYRFGGGSTVRMIIGGIHGGYEANTSTLVYLLRDDLKNGLISVPDEITLYLLPVFNADGFFDYTNLPEGRSNARGVDLNRNWDAFWQANWDKTGCFNYAPITAGESPFSEPETQALRDFLINHHVDAIISYHSAMSAIFAGGRPEPDPASDSLARALSAVSFYLYPPANDPGCQYTGQLIDWASAQGIAAVDIELTDHQSNDILINRKVLEVFLNWKR